METDRPWNVTPKMPTGIAGFDEIAGGGLPQGVITVVLGGAGAGKTSFAMQLLTKGGSGRGRADQIGTSAPPTSDSQARKP